MELRDIRIARRGAACGRLARGLPRGSIRLAAVLVLAGLTGCVPAVQDVASEVLPFGSGAPVLAVQEFPLDINTVGLWHMNEGTGQTVFDSSGNVNDLPLGTSTVVEPTVDPTWTQGMMGGGLHFDQTICVILTFADCHYVNSAPATMTFPSNQVSVEVWVRSTVNTTAMNGIVFWAGFINLDLEVNGTIIYFQVGNGSTWSTLSFTQVSQNVTDGLWHYLAGTYDGGNLILYIDGAPVATTPAITILPAMTGFFIGGRPNNVYWDGTIDEVRVSNIARTAAEILYNYTPR